MIYPQIVEKSSGSTFVRVLSLAETKDILEKVVNSPDSNLLGEVEHEPGLILPSIDPFTDKPIGLHIDNWDKLPYKDRLDSSIRFAVNGGPGHRGMWVGPSIYDFDWSPDEIPSTASLAQYDRFDCELVLVPAYHGYLARTEEIIHDGTTILATEKSRLTTWLVQPGNSLFNELSGRLQ